MVDDRVGAGGADAGDRRVVARAERAGIGHQPLHARDDRLRVQRCAVVEQDPLPELDGVAQLVRRDLRRRGGEHRDVLIHPVVLLEVIETQAHLQVDPGRDRGGRHSRVERPGVLVDPDDERAAVPPGPGRRRRDHHQREHHNGGHDTCAGHVSCTFPNWTAPPAVSRMARDSRADPGVPRGACRHHRTKPTARRGKRCPAREPLRPTRAIIRAGRRCTSPHGPPAARCLRSQSTSSSSTHSSPYSGTVKGPRHTHTIAYVPQCPHCDTASRPRSSTAPALRDDREPHRVRLLGVDSMHQRATARVQLLIRQLGRGAGVYAGSTGSSPAIFGRHANGANSVD